MKQVFQSKDSTRWNRFIWTVRIVIVFIIVSIISILISLLNSDLKGNAKLLLSENRVRNINIDSKKAKVSDNDLIEYAKHLREYRRHKNRELYTSTKIPNHIKQYFPVRAGFYVNWEQKSYYSLKRNAGKLNMVLPEWIFQTDTKGNIITQIDKKALNTMRENKIAIVPMLSNNFLERWNGDSTKLLLKNKVTRTKLIHSVKNILDKNHFQGINIDLEGLPAGSETYITNFIQELYSQLNPAGQIITVDINPNDQNYNLTKLDEYVDFIFVMAYDEHYITGTPGCITSVGFIEHSLNNTTQHVASNKFVLCLAGYGYNWQKGQIATDVPFEEFISLANRNHGEVEYDDDNSDLYMSYTDENDKDNETHCCDACGIFNSMRTAADYELAGVSLWYLGGEDARIWNFYDMDLSIPGLKKHPFNFKLLERIKPVYSVDYDGNGEVLEFASEPQTGIVSIQVDKDQQLIKHEDFINLPVSYLIKRLRTVNKRYIALTFDDGPDENYTPQVLDILKEKGIKASFFLIGVNAEKNIPIVQRIYNEGHDIGNHTFTHPDLANTGEGRERIELRSTQLLLESILGRSTILFRPPYNIDPEPEAFFLIRPLSVADKEGFVNVASSIDPNDWEPGVKSDSIISRAEKQLGNGNIILLHDAGGDREQTIQALPVIIDFYRKNGYQFVTISQLIGKSRDVIMPKVEKSKIFQEKVNYFFLILTFIGEHFLRGFFFVAIILGITRLLALLVMALIKQHKIRKHPVSLTSDFMPKVTVLVPGYNEELNAVRTVENLLKSDYSNIEILFIDDGSKDNTYNKVAKAFENNPKVKVMTKPNGGKASALNFGIERADCDILVCIDADTVLLPDAISKMIPYFTDEDVAAVAGNVRVGNTLNMLTNWQKIEYTTSQNFDRVAFDVVNAILVVPGAIGAFRKSSIDEIGGFTTDTLAEDCDLTVRLLRAGYKIHTCNDAVSMTEAPETMKMFMKQRFRWTFGMMQCLWKHRDLIFNTRLPNMGWILLPNLLIFGFILPLFSPIVDIMFLDGLVSEHGEIYLAFYFMYFVIDLFLAMLAYRYDNQKFRLKHVWLLFVQRFVYRWILFVVLIKAYLRAIKGELTSWGVLKRTGNMDM